MNLFSAGTEFRKVWKWFKIVFNTRWRFLFSDYSNRRIHLHGDARRPSVVLSNGLVLRRRHHPRDALRWLHAGEQEVRRLGDQTEVSKVSDARILLKASNNHLPTSSDTSTKPFGAMSSQNCWTSRTRITCPTCVACAASSTAKSTTMSSWSTSERARIWFESVKRKHHRRSFDYGI